MVEKILGQAMVKPTTETGWKVITHVVPIGDLREHTLTDCWCRPYDDGGITIHNSLDRREFYERGERQVS